MSLHAWLQSSFVRIFPSTPFSRKKTLSIQAALNERFSFQAAVRSKGEPSKTIRATVKAPKNWNIRIRRVGYVPVRHRNDPLMENELSQLDFEGTGNIPGYVPDPLFDEDTLFLPTNETHSFWFSVIPGKNATAGNHTLSVKLYDENKIVSKMNIHVKLHNIVLGKIKDFNIIQWFYLDSLIDWYQTDLFDERFWNILPNYIKNIADHGQNSIYVPTFTPPLDGVKRPHQLLKVRKSGSNKYVFDWTDVKRYIRLAKKCGITHFEWCHPFTQWGVKNAIRIYHSQGEDGKLLWSPETGATSKTYRKFLSQYLPELYNFLVSERILKKSFFHVSDEPHGEEHLKNYVKARNLLKELAPWMKVMDALSDIEYGRKGVTDTPVASISTALDFIREDIPCWCYYCCGPRGRYLNRLMDTPLAKIAMHGFLFYRWPFGGFLHWGYNYWYKSQTSCLIDPFSIQDGLKWEQGWAYGDTFQVYPGTDGPIDSIRWEIFSESLQDYALLQTLGIERNDRMLAPIKSFKDFPKTKSWREKIRTICFDKINS